MNNTRTVGSEYDSQQSHLAATPIVPPGQYKFTPEELRVLQECNNESFLQRSVPFGTILGLGTYFAVQKERRQLKSDMKLADFLLQSFDIRDEIFSYFCSVTPKKYNFLCHLKPNPRFGAFPKMTLAVVMGYFIGKLSYQQACAEKLMALPGSYIGQVLRDRRDGRTGSPPPKQTTTMFGVSPNDIYSDAGPGNSLDLDTDRPLFSDDTFRPGAEVPTANSPEAAPAPPSLSYDDMRRKNRGEFVDSRQDPYRVDPTTVPQVARPRKPLAAQTNQYGDVME